MKIYLRALLFICLVLLAMPVLATEKTAADNACYEGGSLAGKCDWPTEAETEWAWTCGWYIARAENGAFAASDVPSWCGYQSTTVVDNDGCIEVVGSNYPDLRLIGALNTPNNAHFYMSNDGTCQTVHQTITIVTAIDIHDAQNSCIALLGVGYVGMPLSSIYGYPVPTTWYGCASN